MTKTEELENERQASPASVRRVGITFLIATLFGAILVFLGVSSRSYQLRQDHAAGIKTSNLPFAPVETLAPAAPSQAAQTDPEQVKTKSSDAGVTGDTVDSGQ